jgi:hypothetical protein
MTYQKSRAYIILSILAVFLICSPGCSYIMDSIEGRLTDRASFSIEASYDPVLDQVTIKWDERGSSDDFAGYEIYVTEEPNDEYVGYELAASYYEEHACIPSVPNTSALINSTTGSHTVDVSKLLDTIDPCYAPGIYFFRVGLINLDEGDEDDRIDDYEGGINWDSETLPGLIDSYRRRNYWNHTDISKISGYAMVEIY